MMMVKQFQVDGSFCLLSSLFVSLKTREILSMWFLGEKLNSLEHLEGCDGGTCKDNDHL